MEQASAEQCHILYQQVGEMLQRFGQAPRPSDRPVGREVVRGVGLEVPRNIGFNLYPYAYLEAVRGARASLVHYAYVGHKHNNHTFMATVRLCIEPKPVSAKELRNDYELPLSVQTFGRACLLFEALQACQPKFGVMRQLVDYHRHPLRA